jgi:hypothetical protein
VEVKVNEIGMMHRVRPGIRRNPKLKVG